MESHEKPSRVQFGPFQADLRSGELQREGRRIHLQDQPFHVLSVLLGRPRELVTREELRQQVWPSNTFLEFDYALNTAIKKIRIALSDDAVAPRYVQTIPKRGYRWIGPATSIDGCEDASRGERKKTWPAKMQVLGWGVLLGLLLSSFLEPFSRQPEMAPIAVLVGPVRNRSGEPALDLLCRGISQQLIAQIVQSDPSAKIISRPSPAAIAGGVATDVTEADPTSHLAYAVEASLQTSGQQVHMDVELTRSADHARFWAGSFAHPNGDRLEMEADLAHEISVQLIGALHRRPSSDAGRIAARSPLEHQTAVQ